MRKQIIDIWFIIETHLHDEITLLYTKIRK